MSVRPAVAAADTVNGRFDQAGAGSLSILGQTKALMARMYRRRARCLGECPDAEAALDSELYPVANLVARQGIGHRSTPDALREIEIIDDTDDGHVDRCQALP